MDAQNSKVEIPHNPAAKYQLATGRQGLQSVNPVHNNSHCVKLEHSQMTDTAVAVSQKANRRSRCSDSVGPLHAVYLLPHHGNILEPVRYPIPAPGSLLCVTEQTGRVTSRGHSQRDAFRFYSVDVGVRKAAGLQVGGSRVGVAASGPAAAALQVVAAGAQSANATRGESGDGGHPQHFK